MLLFRALAKNMAPMTNADESPTNRLTLFPIYLSLFIVIAKSKYILFASVMREFYKEIDRKNRIFGRKTDILRKFVAGCAVLLNVYGKKD